MSGRPLALPQRQVAAIIKGCREANGYAEVKIGDVVVTLKPNFHSENRSPLDRKPKGHL